MTWTELTKKKPAELSDGERVAIAAVLERSTTDRSRFTMEDIFSELLGVYNHIFSHCDPLPRDAGPQ